MVAFLEKIPAIFVVVAFVVGWIGCSLSHSANSSASDESCSRAGNAVRGVSGASRQSINALRLAPLAGACAPCASAQPPACVCTCECALPTPTLCQEMPDMSKLMLKSDCELGVQTTDSAGQLQVPSGDGANRLVESIAYNVDNPVQGSSHDRAGAAESFRLGADTRSEPNRGDQLAVRVRTPLAPRAGTAANPRRVRMCLMLPTLSYFPSSDVTGEARIALLPLFSVALASILDTSRDDDGMQYLLLLAYNSDDIVFGDSTLRVQAMKIALDMIGNRSNVHFLTRALFATRGTTVIWNALADWGFDIGCDYFVPANDDVAWHTLGWAPRAVEVLRNRSAPCPNFGIVALTDENQPGETATFHVVSRLHIHIHRRAYYPVIMAGWNVDPWSEYPHAAPSLTQLACFLRSQLLKHCARFGTVQDEHTPILGARSGLLWCDSGAKKIMCRTSVEIAASILCFSKNSPPLSPLPIITNRCVHFLSQCSLRVV